jgi:hypothetical protein
MEDAPLQEGVGSADKTKVKRNWPLVDHQNQHHPCLLLSLGQLVGQERNYGVPQLQYFDLPLPDPHSENSDQILSQYTQEHMIHLHLVSPAARNQP